MCGLGIHDWYRYDVIVDHAPFTIANAKKRHMRRCRRCKAALEVQGAD